MYQLRMGWIALRLHGVASREIVGLRDAPPNKPLKQTAAPRRDHNRLPLARGEVPQARSSLPDSSWFVDAAAA
jgi:hypothetical protein